MTVKFHLQQALDWLRMAESAKHDENRRQWLSHARQHLDELFVELFEESATKESECSKPQS